MSSWKTIEGWFTPKDAALYEEWARQCPDRCTIVELGTWYGRSTACLLEALRKAGKPKVRVVAVDCFPRDSLLNAVKNLAQYRDVLRIVQDDVALYAARFMSESVWGVYIDADHSYEGTIASVRAWLPKIQKGGRLGGHDYQPASSVSEGWPGVVRAVDEMFEGDVRLSGTSWEVTNLVK